MRMEQVWELAVELCSILSWAGLLRKARKGNTRSQHSRLSQNTLWMNTAVNLASISL